jgi:hypothetical protein
LARISLGNPNTLSLKKFLFFLSIIVFYGLTSINAQTIGGWHGLVTIPNAEVGNDSELTIGISRMNHNYLTYKSEYEPLIYYVSFVYLPNFELSIRFTKRIGEPDGLGDRMFSLRYRIVSENDLLPFILLGTHDFYHSTDSLTNRFHSTYIVCTKNISVISNVLQTSFTLGYGAKLFNAHSYEFVGLFGGVSIEFFRIINLMNEYDGKRFNGGVRIKLFNNISILGGFLNYQHFSGGASFNFQL